MKSTLNMIVLALFVGLLLPVASAQQVQSMKLLTPQVGWAQSGQHLYWTTDDGAHWKDIAPSKSPKESIGGVFFLDSSNGWVLLSYPDEKDEQQYRMAITHDAGATWSTTPMKLPWNAQNFAGGAEIFFLDTLRGWMNVKLSHGLIPAGARLLVTQDGGKTWTAPNGEPGWAGRSMCFFNQTDGVLAGGGTEGTELWVTHDGSRNWQRSELKAPKGTAPPDATFPTYGSPVCEDSKRGFLPVTFSGSEEGSAFVLFATSDSGRTWKADRVLPNMPDTSPGEITPSAVADSILMVATWSGGEANLASVAPSGAMSHIKLSGALKAVSSLSFADHLHGWAATLHGMYSTSDGGATWTDITPPTGHATAPLPTLPKGKPAGAAPGLRFPDSPMAAVTVRPYRNVGSLTDIHLGFDTGQAPTISQMSTWWNYSPYYDYQISLAGAANHQTNANLTNTKNPWVPAIEGQGWGLWTAWVGPQAPATVGGQACLDSRPTPVVFIDSTKDAYPQGQAEATNAIHALQTQLALGGTLHGIIYYDIENYNTSNTGCAAIVEAFLNGWINGIQSNGYKAGIYGNVAPTALNFSQLSPLPDDVWVAATPGPTTPPSVTIWSLASQQASLCDIYSNPPCPDLWPTDQRIHQYLTDVSQTWGVFANGKPATLSIDPDIVDADVAFPRAGTKTFTFKFTPFYPDGTVSYPFGINNIGTASGNYGNFINGSNNEVPGSIGQIVDQWQEWASGQLLGFGTLLYNPDTNSATQLPGYPNNNQQCGSQSSTCPTAFYGMNNAGWAVGVWNDSSNTEHGFVYNGSFKSFDYSGGIGTEAQAINDAGLVVGSYIDSNYVPHGFLYNANTSLFVAAPLDYPGATGGTLPLAINGYAQITGAYYDSAENGHGFLYSNGNFLSLSINCGLSTTAEGLNDNDQIVGFDDILGVYEGFTWDYQAQTCNTLSYPGSYNTRAYAINDAGQISGSWNIDNQDANGFVAVAQTP